MQRRASRGPDEVAAGSPLGAIAAYLLSRWHDAPASGLLFLSGSERRVEHLGAILHSFDPDSNPLVFPAWDLLPYDEGMRSPWVTGRRASVLGRLADNPAKPLVLSTPDAVLRRVPPRGTWSGSRIALQPGAALDSQVLKQFFEQYGYDFKARADEPGDVAIRGQVIDVFPPGSLGPVRIEHLDGAITSLNAYDAITQRTGSEIASIVLGPATEEFSNLETSPKPPDPAVSFFAYLPGVALVLDDDVEARAELWLRQAREARERGRVRSAGALNAPEYLDSMQWRSGLEGHVAETLHRATSTDNRTPQFARLQTPTPAFRSFVRAEIGQGHRVLLTAADERELRRMAARLPPSTVAQKVTRWPEALQLPPQTVATLRVDLEAGFSVPQLCISVVTSADLFGSRAAHFTPMAPARRSFEREEHLHIGDVVIHLERGLGRILGLEPAPGGQGEMVRLGYAENTSVMVPPDELQSVWRYGSAATEVALDTVDGSSWSTRRMKLERDIAVSAGKLLSLTQERLKAKAPKLIPPAEQYEKFASGFPYVATPDQITAVHEILDDLASGRPMDRLVCADVGFGKTEIAMRAAAVAVLCGKQAIVVVPTTVLARQHVETFGARFARIGVEVGHLSRLVTPVEARAVKARVAEGSLKLVIGTQAILGKDVAFKDLALIIIDEEQRFGTAQKAKLRSFGENVHSLALSATPIPRTLQLTLAGLRSLSVVSEPPTRRLPVRTTTGTFHDEVVRSALRHERRRGGQSFVVCPRIEDLMPMQERLRELAPDLKIVVLHGKMPAKVVDDALMQFASGAGDVLLTTNIIESGLDLPRANTLITWRPSRFGLAQLHQLRGRVGRGSRQGYAYFLSAPGDEGSGAERLQSVQDFDHLGAGFEISTRDLDLRGGGSLFGSLQAGHIKLVGVALYRHLLDQALERLRHEAASQDEPLPIVHADVPSDIPVSYIPDPEVRLEVYARTAKSRTERELVDLEDEIEDRFGPLPQTTRNLLAIARLRVTVHQLSVARLDIGSKGLGLTFRDQKQSLAHDLASTDDRVSRKDGRFIVRLPTSPDGRLAAAAGWLSEWGAQSLTRTD